MLRFWKNRKDKEDIYEEVRYLVKDLIILSRNEFDMQWLKKYLFIIKRIFTKKPNLHVWSDCDKNQSRETCCLDDIVLKEDELIIKSKNFSLRFYHPSHGCFKISRGIGDNYAMHIYSKKNTPSKLSLTYENI